MDLPWGDEKTVQFVTNVGLITSNGPHSQNVMAAEWTHMVSYSPGLIAVCIGPGKATAENIRATKQFGVNLAAFDQNVIASVSGSVSGKEIDKVAVLKDLGFMFYSGKKINALMVEGAALNVECKLVKQIPLGSHTMFVGEALEASASGKPPLAYCKGKYWALSDSIEKPSEVEIQKIQSTVTRHGKKAVATARN